MRVLQVVYDLQVGGVQRMILALVPQMQALGIQVDVCCLKELGPIAEQLEAVGAKVHFIPFRRRLDPIGMIALRRLVSRGNYQVVHSHMYASNVAVNVAWSIAKNVTIVNTYHSQAPFHSASQSRMARLTQGIPDKMIAVSDAARTPLLQAGLKKDSIVVVHNGVPIPEAPCPFEEPMEERPLRILWAGRFVKQKRAMMAVEVANALHKEGIPFDLEMVGDGPDHDSVARKLDGAKVSNQVHLRGWQTDIAPYIRKADIYLSTSNREGFATTLLEVCAQGRGFVVSDIPPNREALGDSEAGIIAGESISEWVSAIGECSTLRERIRRMGQAAYERGREFSLEATARKTIAVYQGMLPN